LQGQNKGSYNKRIKRKKNITWQRRFLKKTISNIKFQLKHVVVGTSRWQKHHQLDF
jgi:hypothetical protein